jgi:hypothetical protein
MIFTQIAPLWAKKSKKGTEYLSGFLSTDRRESRSIIEVLEEMVELIKAGHRISIQVNPRIKKVTEKSPDYAINWVVYPAAEKKQDDYNAEQSESAPPF